MSNESSVRSVERALDILECLSHRGKGYTLSEVAQSVNLPTTTTLRLLTTLEGRNFIMRNTTSGCYCLGRKLAEIGDSVFADLDICSIGYAYLEDLHNRYNESVGLYIAEGKERVCVARIDSTQSLRQCVPIGSTRPIDCGASGHILMAYSKPEQVEEILQTSKFCTKEMLEQVRVQGYSVSHGEYIDGLTSIAAPIFDSKNIIACSLFLTAPSIRVPTETLNMYVQEITKIAAQISAQLGCKRSL